MKKIIFLLLSLVPFISNGQPCSGISVTGTQVAGTYKACKLIAVDSATLNYVKVQSLKVAGQTISGTNTGDQTISINGDVTASGGTSVLNATVTKINGTSLQALGTGLLKNTTGTGVPSIATEGADYFATPSVATTTQSTSTAQSFSVACWGNSITQGVPNNLIFGSYPQIIDSLSGKKCFNYGRGGETSTQIKVRFLQNPDKLQYTHIIECGRNNFTDSATVLADIASIVSAIPHNRYIVISIFNSGVDSSSTSTYTLIMATNAKLAARYGSHYLDVRSYLVSQYNPGLPQDVIDHSRDLIPTSLSTDNLHPNTQGYLLMGQYILSQKSTVLFPASNKISNPEDNAQSFQEVIPASFKGYLSVKTSAPGAPLGATLVTNGTFTGSLTGWTAGANWSASSNRALHTTGSAATLSQSITLETNFAYYVTFDVVGRTAGTVTLTFGSLNGSIDGTTSGTYKYSFFSTSAAAFTLTFTPTSTFDGSIDNVIVERVTRTVNPSFSIKNTDGFNSDDLEFRASQTGLFNTTIGNNAMLANIIGTRLTAVGYNALQINCTGTDNTALGYFAARNLVSGSRNTALGVNCMNQAFSCNDNVGVGYNTLPVITTGSFNVGICTGALFTLSSGGGNIGIGSFAGTLLTTGNNSVFIGGGSGATVTTASHNVGVGINTLSLATGQANTALGRNSGSTISSGTFNTVIGAWSEPASTTSSGQLNIGNVIYGINLYQTTSSSSTPTASGAIGIGVTSPSETLHVNGNLKVKHIVGGTSAPTILAGTGAGTSPTVSLSKATDLSGVINVTTGTLPTLSATIVTITFNVAYGSAPKVTIEPAGANAAALSGVTMVFVDDANTTTTQFVLTSGTTALTAATTYKWYYTVTQ